VILTLLKIDRCFTLLTELQKSRKRLTIKVFKAKTAKGVNRLEPPFSACKAPTRWFDSSTRLQPVCVDSTIRWIAASLCGGREIEALIAGRFFLSLQ